LKFPPNFISSNRFPFFFFILLLLQWTIENQNRSPTASLQGNSIPFQVLSLNYYTTDTTKFRFLENFRYLYPWFVVVTVRRRPETIFNEIGAIDAQRYSDSEHRNLAYIPCALSFSKVQHTPSILFIFIFIFVIFGFWFVIF
jgi:hypothetical protein